MYTQLVIVLATTLGLGVGFVLASLRSRSLRLRIDALDQEMLQREASFQEELSARQAQVAKLQTEIDEQSQSAVAKINEAFHTGSDLASEIPLDLERISELMHESFEPVQTICEKGNAAREIIANGRATLEELSSSLTQLSDLPELVNNVSLHMERVNERSRVIHNVANQANLLSLNAAIEAEHAGDAGRGFSVVANDMSRLSDLSAEAALEISNILGQGIDDIGAITSEIGLSVDAFRKLRATYATTFADTEREISLIADASTALGADSARAVEGVKQVTESTETKMETLTKVLSDLAGLISGNPVVDLTPEDLAGRLGDYKLIDVRTPKEFDGELGHIEGAILCSLQDNFEHAVSGFERDVNYLFICRSGGRSARAARIAQTLGFTRVANLRGGMLAWRQWVTG